MKKSIIAASMMAILGAANMANAASTGTVTFNGELTANTCNVDINGGGPSTTVVLPKVSVNQLQQDKQTAGRTNFVMELSGCSDAVTGVSAFFEAGKDVNATTGLLNNNVANGAKMVSLQLLDGSNAMAPIKAGDSSQVASTALVEAEKGKATLPYAVEYYANGATTPGKVVSIVDYSLNYK